MPFNKAFRLKQLELKEKRKRAGNKTIDGTERGAKYLGDPTFPEQDIHCRGLAVTIKGKLDKYGNWQRE